MYQMQREKLVKEKEMKKLISHYSGKKSEKFWDRINSHRGRTHDYYIRWDAACKILKVEY